MWNIVERKSDKLLASYVGVFSDFGAIFCTKVDQKTLNSPNIAHDFLANCLHFHQVWMSYVHHINFPSFPAHFTRCVRADLFYLCLPWPTLSCNKQFWAFFRKNFKNLTCLSQAHVCGHKCNITAQMYSTGDGNMIRL